MNDNVKIKAVAAYFFPLGWIIALILNKDSNGKPSPFVSYHLEQALGLGIASIALNLLAMVFMVVFFALHTVHFLILLMVLLLVAVSLCILVFMIIGIINAANMKQKPLPLIGTLVEGRFGFLKS